jgi:hypothetical protein
MQKGSNASLNLFCLYQAEESLLSDVQIQTKKKACEAGLFLHCDSGSCWDLRAERANPNSHKCFIYFAINKKQQSA